MHRTAARTLFMILSLEGVLSACSDDNPQNPGKAQNSKPVAGAGTTSTAPNETLPEAGSPGSGGSGNLGGVAGSSFAGIAGNAVSTAKVATPILTDTALWIDKSTNALGLQGQWTSRVGTDSTLAIAVQAGSVCLSGSTAQVPQLADQTYDYANYVGAIASFDLCRTSATDNPPNTTYTLGTCPTVPDLNKLLAGIRFTIKDSATLPRQLRVVFKEKGRDVSPYVVVDTAGSKIALFADATVPDDASAPPPRVGNIESIQFYAYPSRGRAVAFDFCISSLEVLQGAGWSALPDWVYEPGPGQQVQYAGVNLAGAEFGEQKIPGVLGTDYIYPSNADIDIYSKYRMNVLRLPFRWERLQRTLGGPLDATELSQLRSVVDYATNLGMSVILDPHNYARYSVPDPANPSSLVQRLLGTDLDNALFADFWSRLASEFRLNDRVFFGLMNEPHTMATEAWLAAANAAIKAIRYAGAYNLVLVPGNGWTGAHSWLSGSYGTANGDVMVGIDDPASNFVFEMHQYLDADSSGTSATCVNDAIGVSRMAAATDWLRTHGYKGFLGEFNGGASDSCYKALDGLVGHLGKNSDVWLGWTVWAGGPWWGENILTVQPKAGRDRPQMTILRRHLPAQ